MEPDFLFLTSSPRLGSMSRTSRNFVVAYILLVGLPLLALAGVLRSGRHLSAPLSVDGTWKIEIEPSSLTNQACGAVSSLVNSPLLMSQSGRSLEVSFKGKPAGSGSLVDKNLSSSISVGSDSACGNGQVTLAAVVDPKSEPRSLSGQLSFPGCQSCTPIDFRAIRQPRPPTGGGH